MGDGKSRHHEILNNLFHVKRNVYPEYLVKYSNTEISSYREPDLLYFDVFYDSLGIAQPCI